MESTILIIIQQYEVINSKIATVWIQRKVVYIRTEVEIQE